MTPGRAKLVHGGFTHMGMKRNHNEDSFAIDPEAQLFMVADGMGGHNSGEIASRMAVETISTFFAATAKDGEITWPFKYDTKLSEAENLLNVSIRLANSRIWETSQRNDLYRGMGTTIVAAYFQNGKVVMANVGDSRIYQFRNNELRQVTEDHSLLNDYIRRGKFTREEAGKFPHKNVIVRALGIRENVAVDLFNETPQRGDIYLLCSDGLTDMIDDSVISDILMTTPDLKLATKMLVREANRAGGNDNVTVVLVGAQ